MKKGYLANALFSEGEQIFNNVLALHLREEVMDEVDDLYVPQENEALNDKNAYADSVMIATGDEEKLLESDFLVAVLDGAIIDEGVACEIGMFRMTGKPIFALYTDVRQQGRDNSKKIDSLIEDSVENQFPYRNLFVIGQIKKSGGGVYSSIEELIKAINRHYRIKDMYSTSMPKIDITNRPKGEVK